jgi:hypothetical protein
VKLAVPPGGDRPPVLNPKASGPAPHPATGFVRPELLEQLERVRPLAQSPAARGLVLLVGELLELLVLVARMRSSQHAFFNARRRGDEAAATRNLALARPLEHQVDERLRRLRGEETQESGQQQLDLEQQ